MMEPVRTCPVCDQKNSRVLFRPKHSPGSIEQCLHCGMVYVAVIEDKHALMFDGPGPGVQSGPDVLTSANIDDVKGSWLFKHLPEKEAEWPELRQNAMDAIQHIDHHQNKARIGRRILDFGSGWGFFLAAAKEQNWATYGLEPLPALAVYSRATFGLDIITDTLRENTYPPEFFDVITSFQVFEHLPYPKEDIQHLHKILREDGLILIEVPNYDTWTVRIMKKRHRHFVQDHLNFFSIETLENFLTSNRFKILEYYHPTRRMTVRYLHNIWLRKYLPSSLANSLQNTLERSSIWKRSLSLNIGDIITVIAHKIPC